MRKTLRYLTTTLLALSLLVWSNVGWSQYAGTGTFTKITSIEDLVDGHYVVANSGEAFAMNITNAGSFFTHTAITPENEELLNPDVSIVWKIEKDGDDYTISNTTGNDVTYVSYSGSSNASYAVINPETVSDNEKWTITYVTDLFTVANKAISTRVLQYNAGAPRFACYTSAQQRLVFYKLGDVPENQVATPTITPNGGTFYSTPVSVTIETATEAATIYYTTNGDDPTAQSTEYTAAFDVSETTTVKAFAVKADMDDSNIAAAIFNIPTLYLVTFTVKDGTTPIEGAVVTVAGFDPLTPTNANGETTIELADGEHIYSAYATNQYLEAGGKITVNGEALNVPVDLAVTITEEFDYPVGTALVDVGYVAHSGAGTNVVTVSEASISYPNYASSGIGNEVLLLASGEDVNKAFAPQTKDVLYVSLLVNVATVTNADYFFHLGTSENAYYYKGRFFVKKDADSDKIAFGIAHSSTPVYTGYDYDMNTTYLVAMKYIFVEGVANDQVAIYINPVLGEDKPETGWLFNTDTPTDPLDINNFALRQGAAGNAVNVKVDGIRISKVWEEAVKPESVVEKGLFISEYVEGSSNNRAIEIFNPMSEAVDLSAYSVKQSHNGTGFGQTSSDADPSFYVLPLSGTLEPGEVIVIANSQATQVILEVADFILTYDSNTAGCRVAAFTGNDAIGLFKNDELIDQIGDPLSNANFNVAGVTGAGVDHTIVRKNGIVAGNTNWEASAGTNADDSEWILYPNNTFDYLGWHGRNVEAEILTFTLPAQMAPAVIDSEEAKVTLEVLYGTDLTTLVPTFTISVGGMAYIGDVEQESGTSVVNFTDPVVYKIVAESGAIKEWTVTITEADPSADAEILSFEVDGIVGVAEILSNEAKVNITVAVGTDLSAITPTIEVSLGATINPESGVVQDFTASVDYTVTAQDGTTTKVWTVTIAESEIIPIYDIQFTDHPSGDSPYKDQVVVTQGIVTSLHHINDIEFGFFIQDGEGPWNGIYVYTRNQVPAITLPSIGDKLIVSGMVIEYYNYTEITYHNNTGVVVTVTKLSSDNTVPAPTVITTLQGNEEAYEGVLVKVENAKVMSGPNDYEEFILNDDSGNLVSDDKLFNYIPTGAEPLLVVGNRYNITGVMDYSFSEFKLLPRFAEDIEFVSSVKPVTREGVNTFPNPFTNTIWIDNAQNATSVVVVNLIGQQVMSVKLNGDSRTSISTDNLPAGVYLVSIVGANGERTVKKMIKR